jgi:oligopeptide/dipeptide ABC transporter ATP-binding protein
MYAGTLVEIASRDALFAAPIHPYTRALLAAVPSIVKAGGAPQAPNAVAGSLPGGPAGAPQPGCAYRDRCAHAVAVCATRAPPLEEIAPGHRVACHRARDFTA